MPTYSVTIAGTERDCTLESFDLRESINRVPVLAAEFVSSDASFRPAIDQEIIVTEDAGSPAERIFGGVIESAEESGEGGPAVTAIVTRINAVGFASYADRRYVNATLAAGTLKSQLTTLVAYLTDYGVSLDGSQVDGPDMPAMDCEYRKLTDVLNDLSSLSSGSGGSPDAPYLWEIDYAKTLRMFQAGTDAAPVDLIEGDGTEVGDLVVRPTRDHYANRVILRSGGGALVTIADDDDEQDDHGIWETLIDTPADISETIAEQAAAGLLTQFATAQTEARYSTVALGLKPGQVQTITSAKRNVDGQFLITEVSTRQEPNNLGLIRAVTALGNYRLQGSWQDVLARWSTGVGGVGVVGSGGTGGFGGSVGGGFGGGGGGASACDAACSGDLLFSGFGDDPVKVFSPDGVARTLAATAPTLSSSGACTGIVALPSGAIGVVGVTVFDAPFHTESLVVYVSDLSAVAGDTEGESPCNSIARTASRFYTLRSDLFSNTEVLEFDATGAVTTRIDIGETATGAPYRVLGVNADASILYLGKNNGSVIYQFVVATSTKTTFADESASSLQLRNNTLLVLPDGTVLAGWHKSGQGIVRRYATDGSTVQDYTPASSDASPTIVTPGRPNGSSFWVSYYTADAATTSGVRIEEYSTTDGAVLHSFDPDAGSFGFDGPFCVLRAAA